MTSQEARISALCGTEIEQNKYFGPVSTILRLLTPWDGDLSTYYDIIDETEDGNKYSWLKLVFNNNHAPDNRRLIRGSLLPEFVFRFCKSFQKKIKQKFWILAWIGNINDKTIKPLDIVKNWCCYCHN